MLQAKVKDTIRKSLKNMIAFYNINLHAKNLLFWKYSFIEFI